MRSPAERPLLTLDDPGRSGGRITWLFLGSALVVALGTALLTSTLVADAVEARISREIAQTARLLGSGFPLGDASLERVAGFIDAEVVVVDSSGRVVAASLDEARRDAFAAASSAGDLPQKAGRALVGKATLGGERLTVGVAPVPMRRGLLYVLYAEDVIAAEQRRVWVPVSVVALLATLFAALLGRWGERAVQRERRAALLGLLVSVAHELGNPLAAIRSLAEARAGDEESLRLIATEAERLGLLVEGLRSVNQRMRVEPRRLDPDAEVQAVVDLLALQMNHRRVEVSADLAAGAHVDVDPTQLRQIVLNLLKNAADAMTSGGTVRVVSRKTDSCYELEVADDGPGISESVRLRLFEPFSSTKPKGLGVGLYLSRRLAQEHGGDLTYLPGEAGARFTLRLPLSAQQSAPVRSPA